MSKLAKICIAVIIASFALGLDFTVFGLGMLVIGPAYITMLHVAKGKENKKLTEKAEDYYR